MTSDALRKLWTVIGASLLFYTVNAWMQSQGGGLLFKAAMVDSREVPNAYFSIIIIGSLLTLLCVIGVAYAANNAILPRFGRWPAVWLDHLNFRSRAAKLYQGFFLFVFVFVPLAAMVHFWHEIASHGALHPNKIVVLTAPAGTDPQAGTLTLDDLKSPPVEAIPMTFPHGLLQAAMAGDGYCIAAFQDGTSGLAAVLHAKARVLPSGAEIRVEKDPCKDDPDYLWTGGVTWVPVLSPLMIVGLTFSAFCGAALLLWRIFAGPPVKRWAVQ